MRARIIAKDTIIKHDTFEIDENLITEMEGEIYWNAMGSFWGE